MNMDTYFETYPEGLKYRDYLMGKFDGEIQAGMLQFTEDTAFAWGGPFPGNCAAFSLSKEDCENCPAFEEARKEALSKIQSTLKNNVTDEYYAELLVAFNAGNSHVVHMLTQFGSREYPFELYLYGNDDCSYYMWFATLSEAEEFLEMLETSQPLNFYSDFLDFYPAFTN